MESTEGCGVYGATLGKVNACASTLLAPAVLDIVKEQTTWPDPRVYTIGDYGCADGATSMGLIRDVIALVRERSGGRRPVQVLYEDQHSNDFNSLFRRLHGEIPDPPSYLHQFPDVFTMATGASFYQQCVPDEFFHIIFSFFTVHYLSRPLTQLKESLYLWPTTDPEVLREADSQAAEDWEAFLLHRAKELRPGGWLVMQVVVEDVEETFPGYRIPSPDFTLELERAWGRAREAGVITQEEFESTHVNFWRRDPREVRAPFEDPDSPVRRAGLSLQQFRIVHTPCPLMAEWRSVLELTGVDTREETARRIVEAHRSSTSGFLHRGLQASRPDTRQVLSQLYQSVAERLAEKEPFHALRNDYIFAQVFIQKEPEPGVPRTQVAALG